jgi:hypothetical protein
VRLARQIRKLDDDIGQDSDEERRKAAATIFRAEQAAETILRKRWPEILDLAEMLQRSPSGCLPSADDAEAGMPAGPLGRQALDFLARGATLAACH